MKRYRYVTLFLAMVTVGLSPAKGQVPAYGYIDLLGYPNCLPDDGIDDSFWIFHALNYLPSGSVIRLRSGTYDLFSQIPPTAIVCALQDDMTLEGDSGARLLAHGYDPSGSGAYPDIFQLAGRTGFTFRNFEFDMKRPCFTQGRVLSTTTNSTLVMEIDDPRFFISGTPNMNMLWAVRPNDPNRPGGIVTTTTGPMGIWDLLPGTDYSVEIEAVVSGSRTVAQQVTILFQQPKSYLATLAVDDIVVWGHEVPVGGNGSLVTVRGGGNLTLDSVTVRCCAGRLLTGVAVDTFLIDHCTMAPPPGIYLANDTDQVHVAEVKGTATIRDSTFAYSQDDGVNVVGSWMAVIAVDPIMSRIKVSDGNLITYEPNDVIQVLDPLLTGSPGSATIVSVQDLGIGANGYKEFWLTISAPAGFFAGVSIGDMVTNRTWQPTSYLVEGCTFSNARKHGTVSSVPNTTFRANIYSQCATGGVSAWCHFQPSLAWERNGTPPSQLMIQGNYFEECGFWKWGGALTAPGGAIQVLAASGNVLAPAGAIDQLTIERNTFFDTAGSAIYATSVEDFTIAYNTITNVSYEYTSGTNSNAIYLENCTGGFVVNNTVWTFNNFIGRANTTHTVVSGNSLN
ncbi:MAG: right-handed parallel beta-helix repeat-containing protein [Planctomycetes bacterium]|nr:right-handed parallel beta-helix repeat-containing protein [Planctomycetota bacterium]